MATGFRYRVVSVTGTIALTVLAVLLANIPAAQYVLTTFVPVVNRLNEHVLTNGKLVIAMLTTTVVVVVNLVPFFKPRPRRILDSVFGIQRRILLASFTLAAIGYFDWTYKLPRSTLIATTLVLIVALPAFFGLIRRRPTGRQRAIIIGDDPDEIAKVLETVDIPIIGYVSPPSPYYAKGSTAHAATVTDGSGGPELALDCLGGLSRLDDILVEHNVDTAILAFTTPDRAEFFGALDECYSHGVDAKVHRNHTNDVLTVTSDHSHELVDIELEPWDWQDYVFKRLFDIGFAAVGLLVFLPFIVVIAAAVRFDSSGPIFYKQKRTAAFGETFEVTKFRTMVPDAEAETGATISQEDAGGVDPRVTRVGRVLRKTHFDEIPQLWSILVGDMSVVGPRPERPELEVEIRSGVVDWRKRWFIKPGLTGLAQVNDVTGNEPNKKLRYDVQYIQQQSFWFDVKIVVRQVWKVLEDLLL